MRFNCSLCELESAGCWRGLSDLRRARARHLPALQVRAGGGGPLQHQVVQGRQGEVDHDQK